MLNVCLRVRVKWLQFSCCVSRLTVCPYVLHLLMSITPANQGHINQQWCQEAWGRESARPLLLSITLAVNCHLASNIDFFFFFLLHRQIGQKDSTQMELASLSPSWVARPGWIPSLSFSLCLSVPAR